MTSHSYPFPESTHINPFAGLMECNPSPFERQQLCDLDTAIVLIWSGFRDSQTIDLFTTSLEHVENMAKERYYHVSEDWDVIKSLTLGY